MGAPHASKDHPIIKAVTFFYLAFSFFPMQTSPVFYSTSMCSDHKFGDLEMVSSQNNKESEKETSPRLHPEALTAVFQQSGSQSPDSRMVGATPLPLLGTREVVAVRFPSCLPHCGMWHPLVPACRPQESRRAGCQATLSCEHSASLFLSLAEGGGRQLIPVA